MNPYDVDIRDDLATAARKAGIRLVPGWFRAEIPLPAAVYYLLSAPITDYIADKPTVVRFNYYFEVRAMDAEELENTAKALCKGLSEIHHARRTQYDDAFDADYYIKRINFIFTVKIGA